MANKIWAFWDEAPWGVDTSHIVWYLSGTAAEAAEYALNKGPHIKFTDGEFDTLADAIRKQKIG